LQVKSHVSYEVCGALFCDDPQILLEVSLNVFFADKKTPHISVYASV